MDAKVAAGYYTDSTRPAASELAVAKGRSYTGNAPDDGKDG